MYAKWAGRFLLCAGLFYSLLLCQVSSAEATIVVLAVALLWIAGSLYIRKKARERLAKLQQRQGKMKRPYRY